MGDLKLAAELRCVLVTDGDGSLNDRWMGSGAEYPSASSSPTGMGVSTSWRMKDTCGCCGVRPRHRRGWESQQGSSRLRCEDLDCVRPRHRRGWESQLGLKVECRTPLVCVLVTDGDGSLNPPDDAERVTSIWCVLVTDGDGSLNIAMAGETVHMAGVRPRHRRGWESQHPSRHRQPQHRGRASSSPTGMGVSTSRSVQPRRIAARASSSPTGMGVSTRSPPT